MTNDKAETFLSLRGEEELRDFMAHLKKIKLDKKTKKKKYKFGKKRKNRVQGREVKVIKRCKMDEQGIIKKQSLTWNQRMVL